MIQFDEHIFQMGWFNHQLVMIEVLNPEKQIGKQIPRMYTEKGSVHGISTYI